MSALKTIASMVPGPALTFVGQWIDLLSSTVIANPVWQVPADKFALGFGAILTVFIAIGFAGLSPLALRRWFGLGCVLVVVAVAVCWGIWLHLGPPPRGAVEVDPTRWQDVWETAYVCAQTLLVTTISVGALSLEKGRPWLFWLLVAVAILLLIVVGYFVFWPG